MARSIPAWLNSIPGLRGSDQWNPLARVDVSTVYPRVCGGTRSMSGPSLGIRSMRVSNPGTVPKSRVYPRVCGGTHLGLAAVGGLSPRVRGNRGGPVYPRVCGGTIATSPPLRTMPSVLRTSAFGSAGVYPRVCGGTRTSTGRDRCAADQQPLDGGTGSIPACAGEPTITAPAGVTMYKGLSPRVRGNLPSACRPVMPNGQSAGLSPRVRGNRPSWPANPYGLSRMPYGEAASRAVYPRVCGGTGRRAVNTPQPRRNLGGGVYPRVCGGTSASTIQSS